MAGESHAITAHFQDRALRGRIERLGARFEDAPEPGSLAAMVDHLLGQVSDELYPDEFHFLLELIQNAVDSAAKSEGGGRPVRVRFRLATAPDRLVVDNDGAPFSAEDIGRLCGDLKHRKGPRKIGYKGIGFKSVARVTVNPQIYSPGCQFEFDRARHPAYEHAWLVMPHPIPAARIPDDADPERVTLILPLRVDLPPEARERLSAALDRLPPSLALFLDLLGELAVVNERSGRSFGIRKRRDEHGTAIVERLPSPGADAGATVPEPLGRWIVTAHAPRLPLPDDARRNYLQRRGLNPEGYAAALPDVADTAIKLGFRLDDGGRFAPEEGPLYAFLPLASQRSGLRFAVQADFLTTPDRAALSTGPWNAWLVANLPDAIVAALGTIKGHPSACTVLYDALPLAGEAADPEAAARAPLLAAVAEVLPELRRAPIVATGLPGDDAWVTPAEAAWAEPALRGLIAPADLELLFPGARAFASPAIAGGRAVTFLTSPGGLGVRRAGKAELMRLLAATGEGGGRPNGWYAGAFAYLGDAGLDDAEIEGLRRLPIVPTTAGLRRADDAVFLPAPAADVDATGACFVLPEVAGAGERVWRFLNETLDIPEATLGGLIERVVVPALKREGETLPEATSVEYLARIHAYFATPAGRADDATRDALRSCVLLPARDGSLRPPGELCLAGGVAGRSMAAGDLLADAPPRFFPDLGRLPADDDPSDFLEWLGVHATPSVALALAALADGAWYVGKPLGWFRALFAWLEAAAGERQLAALRALPIVPLGPNGGSVRLERPAPAIFFAGQETDDRALELFRSGDLAFVHPGLLAPGERGEADAAGGDPRRARMLLEKLGITALTAEDLIARVVVDAFARGASTTAEEARLLAYTRFACETFGGRADREKRPAWRAFAAAVTLKATNGAWRRPAELFLTAAYGPHDLEAALGGLGAYVSPDYLAPAPGTAEPDPARRERWRDFLGSLGVRGTLRLSVASEQKNFDRDFYSADRARWTPYIDSLIEQVVGGQNSPILRFYERHRIRGHATIEYLEYLLPARDRGAARALVALLADRWAGEDGYGKYAEVAYQHQWNGWQPARRKPSHFAWLLATRALLPTTRGIQRRGQARVYRDIPELRRLVGDRVIYLDLDARPQQRPFLRDFMGVIWEPAEADVEDVLRNLRRLRDEDGATVQQTAAIYDFLAKAGASDVLKDEALIFLPGGARRWWRPRELFWADQRPRFGELRGYLSAEPAYAALSETFGSLGANIGEPGPRDWADLLLSAADEGRQEESARQVIWEAYRQLEAFLGGGEAPAALPGWWIDFAGRARLLTVEHGFVSPDDGLYIPDEPVRQELFRDALPCVWLADTHRRIPRFLGALGLRRLGDPRWIEASEPRGEEADPRAAEVRRLEIAENVDYVYSILAHRYPGREDEFLPHLALLLPDSPLGVRLLNPLAVDLRTTEEPRVVRMLPDEVAFYWAPGPTLYLSAAVARGGVSVDPEALGIGVALLFGDLADGIRADLLTLFLRRSHPEKRRLLERHLQIAAVSAPFARVESALPEPVATPASGAPGADRERFDAEREEAPGEVAPPESHDPDPETATPVRRESLSSAPPTGPVPDYPTPASPDGPRPDPPPPGGIGPSPSRGAGPSTPHLGPAPTAESPSVAAGPRWQVECSPGEAEVRVRDHRVPVARAGAGGVQVQGGREEESSDGATGHPDARAIGEWGERYALRCLAEYYRRKYPEGELVVAEEGFSVHVDGERLVLGRWLNAGKNQNEGYDLSVEDGSEELFIEVKATSTEARASIDLSGSQWRLANRSGERFILYRVYNAGRASAWATAIPDPVGRWRAGVIGVAGIRLSI